MDNQSQNQPPEFNPNEMKFPATTARTSSPTPRGFGLVLVGLVAFMVIVLVGLYYWYLALPPVVISDPSLRPSEAQNREPESTNARAQTGALNTMSTSNELSAINADIESTDITNLDTELIAIEAEITAAATATTTTP